MGNPRPRDQIFGTSLPLSSAAEKPLQVHRNSRDATPVNAAVGFPCRVASDTSSEGVFCAHDTAYTAAGSRGSVTATATAGLPRVPSWANAPPSSNTGPSRRLSATPKSTPASMTAVPSKMPSRRDSLESLTSLEAAFIGAAGHRGSGDASCTAPPPRLPPRAITSGTTSPAVSATQLTPPQRHLTTVNTIITTALATPPSRLRTPEADRDEEHSRSASHEHSTPQFSYACSGTYTRGPATSQSAPVVEEACRNSGSAPRLLGSESGNGVVTLVVKSVPSTSQNLSSNGSSRAPSLNSSVSIIHGHIAPPRTSDTASTARSLVPPSEAEMAEISAPRPRPPLGPLASAPLTVFTSSSSAGSPPVGQGTEPVRSPTTCSPITQLPAQLRGFGRPSTATTANGTRTPSFSTHLAEAVSVGREGRTSGSYRSSTEAASPLTSMRSSSAGAAGSTASRKVHFKIQEATSAFDAAAVPTRGVDELKSSSSGLRAVAPPAAAAAVMMCPLAADLSHSSLAVPALTTATGATLLTSSIAGAASGTSNPAPPSVSMPILSLRLNRKDGRIEATTTPVVTAAPPSIMAGSAPLPHGSATYQPQLPVPKPALKSQSRYTDTRSESARPSTRRRSTSLEVAFPPHTDPLRSSTSSALRGLGFLMESTLPSRRNRNARAHPSAPQAAALVGPSSRRGSYSGTPVPLYITWVLLGIVALLSLGLVLLATAVE